LGACCCCEEGVVDISDDVMWTCVDTHILTQVRFSAAGETLSFKHDVTDYKAFCPGVLLSIRRVVNLKTFVYGIDKLL